MMEYLKGKKTNLVAMAMVVVAGLHAQGFIDASVFQLVESILMGGGFMALRAGVDKN